MEKQRRKIDWNKSERWIFIIFHNFYANNDDEKKKQQQKKMKNQKFSSTLLFMNENAFEREWMRLKQ